MQPGNQGYQKMHQEMDPGFQTSHQPATA